MNKSILWILAVLLTLSGVYYTRRTGPTKPVSAKVSIAGEEIRYKLIRTYFRPADAPVKIAVESSEITGRFIYKRTPSNDSWTEGEMVREGEHLIAYLPQQPPAGKVMYQITLEAGEERVKLTDNPIVIRFRGDVPAWAMIPHILLMFAALLFSTRAGLGAIFKEKTFNLSLLTLTLLVFGGLVFGPVVQKFAFGAYWTGWPFGTDLTDNKTAIMVLFWAFAMVKLFQNKSHRAWVIVASVVLMLVYMIPHSLMGSEIDFTQVEPETVISQAVHLGK
jgi:hypothetical protein